MEDRKIRIPDRLKRAVGLDAAPDPDELDQPNLRRDIVAGILRLKRRGRRGMEMLPRVVSVSIEVGHGSVDVVRSIVDDPEFDDEVEADLLNRLVKIHPDGLPVRLYRVRKAARTEVTVTETTEGNLAWLQIEGGDQHEMWYPVSASQTECRIGRGPWHGDEELVPNDVVVSRTERFVSRRAALLRRVGSGLMVEALDQGDEMTIVSHGRRIRPTHVRGGAVRVRPGDVIEFNDGKANVIKVRVHGVDEDGQPLVRNES